MASLLELQRSFAAALRDPAVDCPVTPRANLGIYRNNSAYAFASALEAAFPVVRRRVGDDYFAQLGFQFRARFPSRSGDLNRVGEPFAAFLAEHLSDGEYAWLADLARLEWAREEALVSSEAPAVGANALAGFSPDELEALVFHVQPSLRLVASAYPIFSVWQANQIENAPPMDQSWGLECGLVRLWHDSVEIRQMEAQAHSWLYELAGGATLGEATVRAGLDEAALLRCLAFAFGESLVTGVELPVR